MSKSLKKAKYTALFRIFSIIGIFFKNQNITKRKLLYGAIIIGLTAVTISCRTHRRTCYKVAATDYHDLNDTTEVLIND